MSKTKWFQRVGVDEYAPTMRCLNCDDWVFPAPTLWTRWVGPNSMEAQAAVTPEGRWVHISTLRAECGVLTRLAIPKALTIEP